MATAYRSSWADDEIVALKEMTTKFLEAEALPHSDRWVEQKCVDREFWLKAGEIGLLCASIPEEYGGGGGTFVHDLVIAQASLELTETGFGIGAAVHSGL